MKRIKKEVGVEPAYKNEAGKPIMRNGCPMCGLLSGHTATCPSGTNPSPRRTPLDPV